MSRCAPFVQGALAFGAQDLISNGFIPEVGTVREEEIRLLPSNRISAEFQYSVRSDISGTSLNDLSPGGNTGFIFGGLGGGAGFGIGAALGCSLLGDFEPTVSRFIWHFADMETRINRGITITQAYLDEANSNEEKTFTYRLPVATAGVLGVTQVPIEFTEEEEDRIGISSGATRGHRISSEGQIEASFTNFNPGGEENLFVQILRDERKYAYRADNDADRFESNCFTNNGGDDCVDRVIQIKLTDQILNGTPATDDADEIPGLQVGDRLFITYSAVINDELRHAIEARSFFFLFPGFQVERIGIDQVKAYNFKPFTFKAHKEQGFDASRNFIRADLVDLARDEEILSNPDLTFDERLEATTLSDLTSQRIIEVLNDTKNKTPFINGIYFADTRGILSWNAREPTAPPELLIAAADIRDQDWWTSFINGFVDFGPGFNDDGELDPSDDGANRKLRGFLFDISDHVNTAVFDNEKFGYQRDLAEALASVSRFDAETEGTGIGFPNLDLIKNRVSGRNTYDLGTAKFEKIQMSSIEGGAYFVRSCNEFFTYDQQFCGSGTIQADMFVRTPFFFFPLTKRGRIFVERFTPQFALDPDGGIWVFTNPVGGETMTIAVHPYREQAFVVFSDSSTGETTLRYFPVRDSQIQSQLQKVAYDSEDINRNHSNQDIDNLSESDTRVLGFDKVIGNQPGHSRGLQITLDAGQIARGLKNVSDIYEKFEPTFNHNTDSGEITITGLQERRLRNMKITYKVSSSEFYDITDRRIAAVFPNSRSVIDGVVFPGGPNSNKKENFLILDTRYYADDSIRLQGDALSFIEIVKIEMIALTEEAYEELNVAPGQFSSCFDVGGNWYIFYEDPRAEAGEYGTQPGSGSLSTGNTEISCLVSPDLGDTWFDHKGIVITSGDEEIRSPFVVHDWQSNRISLFYVLNDTLFEKEVDPNNFDSSDSFKAYQRPFRYDENTPKDFGVAHFTQRGKDLRQTVSNVVIGNIEGEFLTRELEISSQRLNQQIDPDSENPPSRFRRFGVAGDRKSYEEGFPEVNYIVTKDNRGILKVIWAANGRLFTRVSRDDGTAWYDGLADESNEGIGFHKNNLAQEVRFIGNVGAAFDDFTDRINIAYLVDGMMFVRQFDSDTFNPDRRDRVAALDSESTNSPPIFCVGQLGEDVAIGLEQDNSNIIFSYPGPLDHFNETMAISDIPPVGYTSASGYTRFYYKDTEGTIRGLTISGRDVELDVKQRVIDG